MECVSSRRRRVGKTGRPANKVVARECRAGGWAKEAEEDEERTLWRCSSLPGQVSTRISRTAFSSLLVYLFWKKENCVLDSVEDDAF